MNTSEPMDSNPKEKELGWEPSGRFEAHFWPPTPLIRLLAFKNNLLGESTVFVEEVHTSFHHTKKPTVDLSLGLKMLNCGRK